MTGTPEEATSVSDRRRPSRRSLLLAGLGAAGAAVGAGSVAVVDAAGADPTEPHVASPGEELMVEHGVLKRILLAYRAMDDRLADGRTFPVGALADAAQIVSDFVESFHEGLEEAYVFPRVAAREPALVRTLLVQHDRGRHLTATLQDLASVGLRTPASRTRASATLRAFVRMYEPHEAWEDTVVYPTLRAVTPQRTLDELAERFSSLQNRQYGDHALMQLLDRVGGIEEQLGIHDLAAFTPAGDS